MTKDEFEKLIEQAKTQQGKVAVPMGDGSLLDFLKSITTPKEEVKEEVSYTEREAAYEEYLMKIDLATEMYLEGVLNALTINRMIFNKAVNRFKSDKETALRKSITNLEKTGNVVKFPNSKETNDGK